MTVEFWTSAERFYELWVFILGLLFLFFMIALIFVVSYTNKENRTKAILVVMTLLATVGLIGLRGHFEYHPYLEQARYSNALIRDRQPKLHTYEYYSETEEIMYSHLNGIESLRKMVLYEEEPVSERLSYLGQDENFYYFEHFDGALFKQTLQVRFNETIDQVLLKGSRFTLIDEEFKEIGFKNPEYTMYDSIEIPATEQDKHFDVEEEEEAFIPRIENALPKWNF